MKKGKKEKKKKKEIYPACKIFAMAPNLPLKMPC